MVWGSAARILRSLVSSAGPYQGSEGSLRALRVIFLHPTRARVRWPDSPPSSLSVNSPTGYRTAFPFAIPGRNYRLRNPSRLRQVVAVIIVPFICRSLASLVRHTYQKGPDACPHWGGRALTRRGDAQQEIRDRAALALCFVQKGLHTGVAALLNHACPCGSSSMRSRPAVSGTRTKKPSGA
jgi:hypothetical protein